MYRYFRSFIWSSRHMVIGRGGDGFYLSQPHTQFLHTYMLSYSYSADMRNRIWSSSSTSLGIPASSLSLQWIVFFINKNKVFFGLKHNDVMYYPAKRWWRLMAMVMEKREAESVRYRRRKKRTMISECHMKDWDSTVWVKWFWTWVSIYIKGVINWFSTFGRFWVWDRVGTYIFVTRPVPVF